MARPTKRNNHQEQMSPDRESWVDIGRFQVLLFDAPVSAPSDPDPEDITHGGDLPQYKISIRFPGRRSATSLNLNALTVPELNALEEFFIRAFKLARPVCEQLDERAKTAFEEGDETYVRLYRPVPRLYVRKRSEREQREGIPERSGVPVEVHSDGEPEPVPGGAVSGSVPDRSAVDISSPDDPA